MYLESLGMRDEVSAYLEELRRRLPATLRRRFLQEARDHIEDGGLDAFGPLDEVASRMRRELARETDRLATRGILRLVAVYVIPLYVIPENTLPPAPWDTMPSHLAWKVTAAEAAFAAAAAIALLAVAAVGALRRFALFGAVGALAASALVALPLAWQWPVGSGFAAGALAAGRIALALAVACTVYAREVACAQRR
jgi:hypothetical protein